MLFPTIILLAHDILSIPVTSVSVKQVFSIVLSRLKPLPKPYSQESKVWIRSGLFKLKKPKVLHRKYGSMMDVDDS
jgi:hypothetical protein